MIKETKTTRLRLITATAITLFVAIATLAQAKVQISGRVTDELGAAIAGATIKLHSRTGFERTSRTDSKGEYGFAHVPRGEYLIEASADRFSTEVSELIAFDSTKPVQNNFQLKVGAISEEVVVTATGSAQSNEQVGKTTTTVTRDEIENRGEATLSESLRGTAALRVQQQGSPGGLVNLRFRGQRNSDTSILLDGLRVRDASDISGSAAPLFSDILPSDLDRVEILRGSGSSIYGTNAIGGVINLVPLNGSGSHRFNALFSAGNLGMYQERLGGSGGIGPKAGYSFNVTRLDYRKGVDSQDQFGDTTATGRIQFNPIPTMLVAGNFWGSFANARVNDSPFALPGAFTSGSEFPPAVEGQTFHADINNPDEGRRTNFTVGSVRLTQSIGERFVYSAAYQHVSSHRRNYNGPAIDPKFATFYPFGDFEFTSINRGATDTFDTRGSFQADHHNLLTAGFEYEHESIYQESIPSFSSVNKTTDRQRTYAVFGQDQLTLLDGRLALSVAVRAQGYRIQAADRPDFLSSVNPQTSVVGDGAIAYFVAKSATKFRAHLGNGFRAPSLFERFGEGTFSTRGFTRFGDPTIRAEQSISVDGGIDQQLVHDRLKFGVTYFYTHLQRTINFTSFSSDPLGLGRFSGYENGPGGLSRGVEMFVESHPIRGMNLSGTYTFTNSVRNVKGAGLQPEFVIPRHLFGMSFSQGFRAVRITANLDYTGNYVSPVFENDFPFRVANLRFSGYTKFDIAGNYRHSISEKMQLVFFAGSQNLFDQKYFENGYRAPGITVNGGVKIEF